MDNTKKHILQSQKENIRNCKNILLSLVVPVFNEAESINIFVDKIKQILLGTPEIQVEVLFVNDGSTDNTLSKLLERQQQDSFISVIDLSRNFGKESALTAGLYMARGDIVIPMDVDLQDPPEIIPEMIGKWRQGYEVVVGRRINRDSDSFAKRTSANWFYRLHNKISTPSLPENVGDFRLMDRCVIDALKELPETCRFMKGIFSWIGFRTTYIDYVRPERAAGTTKFNGWKLWNFALEGITSFSTVPLRIWTYIGFLVSLLSFAFGFSIALKVLLWGIEVPGYASLLVGMTFLGGLQLIGIGILGEYLGRAYMETKRRPIFLIRNIYKSQE